MDLVSLFLFAVLLVCTRTEDSNGSQVAAGGKTKAAAPTSVEPRFGFGLGGLGGLINNLMPGFNLGDLGGFGGYPSGTNFPANSQFYPNSPPVQITTNAPVSSGQGGAWPVIDDVSQFNKPGSVVEQTQYPTTQGAQWGYPQNGQGNFGGNSQYPNQGNYPNQMLQYPIQGNYPNQMTQYPNQGFYPNQMTQYPNQGNFPNQMTQHPNQGNYPNQMTQYPNQGSYVYPQGPSYPSNNGGGNTMPIQFPSQGVNNGNQYPNSFQPGSQEGGTLDSIVPPSSTSVPDTEAPPFQNPTDGNAVLGNPVIVPPADSVEAGKVNFPSSTMSPSKKQCVQDCQTTSEYNPVCGSDNVTYINPGKFVCARNCGINVFVAREGRCPK